MRSALSLLVLGVLADDHNVTFSLDDLALFADLLNGWFNFHGLPYLSHNYVLKAEVESRLFRSPCDPSLCKVIDRNLDRNLIPRKNLYIVHTELTRNMGGNDMLIGKLHFEYGIGQSLDYRTLEFNNVILRQNDPSYR